MSNYGVVPPPPPPSLEAPLSTAPAQPAAPVYDVLHGPNGLRAGWRALLFLAIAVVVFLVLGIAVAVTGLARKAQGTGPSSMLAPLGLSISEGTTLLMVTVASLIMSRIERRKFGAYGLPWRYAFGKNFWIGTLAGFAAISASLLAIFAFHGFTLTGLALHGKTMLAATAAWSATFVIVGLSEEFAFRGYLQYTLTTGMGFWPSAVLLSLLFGATHLLNPGETVFGIASVVVFGLLFCLFLRRTGNLWWAVGFHAGWDWGQTFFYGVPDSGLVPYNSLFTSALNGPRWLTGGSVGPEASVFAPIALLMVAVLFSLAYRETPASGENLNAAAMSGSATS
jgi:uncharacterized protein